MSLTRDVRISEEIPARRRSSHKRAYHSSVGTGHSLLTIPEQRQHLTCKDVSYAHEHRGVSRPELTMRVVWGIARVEVRTRVGEDGEVERGLLHPGTQPARRGGVPAHPVRRCPAPVHVREQALGCRAQPSQIDVEFVVDGSSEAPWPEATRLVDRSCGDDGSGRVQ